MDIYLYIHELSADVCMYLNILGACIYFTIVGAFMIDTRTGGGDGITYAYRY